MTLPEPVFIGFFPKLTEPSVEGLGVDSVKEICSVSNCISSGPHNWINQWKHNELGFYNSEEIACEVIGEDPNNFDIYAYKLFPLRCFDDEVELISIESAKGSLPPDYQFLGYDIVTKSVADFFECSPLSCNSGASQYPVNEFCLIADREAAYRVLCEISEDGAYEPGPYYLFEVYRKRRESELAVAQ